MQECDKNKENVVLFTSLIIIVTIYSLKEKQSDNCSCTSEGRSFSLAN